MRSVVSTPGVSQIKSGEVVRCRVTIKTTKPLDNVIVQVPIPSNMRIIDEEEPLDGMSWQWWWARSVFTDDRAVFFGSIPADKPQIIEFAVRAESPGLCIALPAELYRMYQPDERYSTSAFRFEVTPK